MLLSYIFPLFIIGILLNANFAAQVNHYNINWDAIEDNTNVLYKVFIESQGIEFTDAEEKCLEYKSHLASFHTVEEYKFINRIVEQAISDSTTIEHDASFWLGLYHTREIISRLPNFYLYFADGTPYDLPSDEGNHSLIWARLAQSGYEPNGRKHSDNSVEFCVQSEFTHVQSSEIQRRLNDVICHTENKVYVCKYDANNTYEERLPPEIETGQISNKRTRPTSVTMLHIGSLPVNTTAASHTTKLTSLEPKSNIDMPDGKASSCKMSQNAKGGDTFYFVLFLIASAVLLGETAYIFWLHKKNPGLNSFTFQNF